MELYLKLIATFNEQIQKQSFISSISSITSTSIQELQHLLNNIQLKAQKKQPTIERVMKTLPVILSLLQVWVVVAMPTCQLEGHLIQVAHGLLQNLGEDIPGRCLPYNTNMSFPESAFTGANNSFQQCHKALWVMSESLNGFAQIMEDSAPLGEGEKSWNQKDLDDFQNIQYQILDQGQCLTYKDTNTSAALASYFTNVATVIQQQDTASCGWMALRADLLRVLRSALQKHDTCFTWRD